MPPFYVVADVVENLGGYEATHQVIGALVVANLMPRRSGEHDPYTEIDLDLARRNQEIGSLHWHYVDCLVSGGKSHYGYGYWIEQGLVGGTFQFINFNPERLVGDPVLGDL